MIAPSGAKAATIHPPDAGTRAPGPASGATPWTASAAELCASIRMPPDAASYATLSAMLGERMPLDGRNASAIRRAVRRHDADPAAARAVARALAAGLDPDDPAVERLLGAIVPAGEGGSDAGGSGGADGSGGRSGDGRRHGDTDEREELDALASALRAAAEAAMADGDFSAMARPLADGSGWVCAPFSVPLGDVSFHGYMRIWYTSNGSVRRVGRMAADIRFGDERRLFELSTDGARRTVAYYADDRAERDAFEAEFGDGDTVVTAGLEHGYLSELASRRSVDEDA